MFSGFALGLNTLSTVIGVWYLRKTKPDLERPFRMPWYPWPMLIFVALMLWTLVYVIVERPVEGLLAIGLVVVGWCFYLVSSKRENQR